MWSFIVMAEKQQPKLFIKANCPSCRTETKFTFLGVQEWHPEVAAKFGVPSKINLYRCDSCDTSVNEFALRDDSATAG